MSAADHLRDAINEGCTRDDHDHIADHRAEVLAEDGQAYDGELAMLRSLVRTLRAVTRPDDADLGEVRRLLHHHAADDAAAREQGKSSHPADATPDLRDILHTAIHTFQVNARKPGGYDQQLTDHILTALTERGDDA